MKYLLLLLLTGIFLFSFSSADSYSFTMNFIVPDQTAPTFDNLVNKTGYVNESFTFDVDATDPSGISCFTLNDTSVFNIDCSGIITNVTILDTENIYWLNITVNDTLNNINWEEFYINITTRSGVTTTSSLCRYRKFGYYNTQLNWFKEIDCI